MPLGTIKDREYDKFDEVDGRPVVRINNVGGTNIPPHDEVQFTYSDGLLATTSYLKNSVVLMTITYSYTDGILQGFTVS